ncbi:hypothetical protein MAR_006965 [Mya arenaria]|uniref:Integrase n=1 Tax=Mya arenaria TaxID=6604 RepID=A0ABY7DAZ7_MYAAR|nr:hypothetical protein MAR_006965 [Mya arenaria]
MVCENEIGRKEVGRLLKKMASDGGLDSNKRITNHSTRKHLDEKSNDHSLKQLNKRDLYDAVDIVGKLDQRIL